MNVGDISADVDIPENACAIESIVDQLLLEAGDAFECMLKGTAVTIANL